MSVRLERRASDHHIVSVEIRDDADATEVAAAAYRLRRAADIVADLDDTACPYCYAFRGMFHNISCPLAPDDILAGAHADAVAHGMRP
jgi:hypothetical protein